MPFTIIRWIRSHIVFWERRRSSVRALSGRCTSVCCARSSGCSCVVVRAFARAARPAVSSVSSQSIRSTEPSPRCPCRAVWLAWAFSSGCMPPSSISPSDGSPAASRAAPNVFRTKEDSLFPLVCYSIKLTKVITIFRNAKNGVDAVLGVIIKESAIFDIQKTRHSTFISAHYESTWKRIGEAPHDLRSGG